MKKTYLWEAGGDGTLEIMPSGQNAIISYDNKKTNLAP
jgi:hypothetical protein